MYLQISAAPPKVKGSSLAMMPGESLNAAAMKDQKLRTPGATPLPDDYQDNLQPLSAARVSQHKFSVKCQRVLIVYFKNVIDMKTLNIFLIFIIKLWLMGNN